MQLFTRQAAVRHVGLCMAATSAALSRRPMALFQGFGLLLGCLGVTTSMVSAIEVALYYLVNMLMRPFVALLSQYAWHIDGSCFATLRIACDDGVICFCHSWCSAVLAAVVSLKQCNRPHHYVQTALGGVGYR